MPAPIFVCEDLTTMLENRALGRWLSNESGTLRNEISVFRKEVPESCLNHSSMCKHNENVVIDQVRSGMSLETELAGTLS